MDFPAFSVTEIESFLCIFHYISNVTAQSTTWWNHYLSHQYKFHPLKHQLWTASLIFISYVRNLNGDVIHPCYYYDDTTGDVYALEIK